jgi:hypothetical protein
LGCLLITLWFGSGLVMMYVAYPTLSDGERLAALAPIDGTRVVISPSRALELVMRDAPGPLSQLRLIQPLDGPNDAPVYALRRAEGPWRAVDARAGSEVRIDAAHAQRSAERFAGVAATGIKLIERDQWSLSGSLDPHRPLYAVAMVDGGLHYVSSRTGEVVRDTARAERAWNWVGSVVHWIYPTVLRSQAALWHWVVVGLTTWALATALLGTVIGIVRWRPRGYANGRTNPYRGWLRWHLALGLGAAVFVLSWLFSGLMSMNPFNVFSQRSPTAAMVAAWRAAELEPTLELPLLDGAREVSWFADRGGSLAWVRANAGASYLVRGAQTVVIDTAFVRRRAALLGLGVARSIEFLPQRDAYLNLRHVMAAPPVWRVRYDDSAATWLHVDARNGQLVGRINRSNRAQRWLYHGLHSWDFEVLHAHRPLWDALMLPAMLLGLAFAVTSVAVAVRRLLTRKK